MKNKFNKSIISFCKLTFSSILTLFLIACPKPDEETKEILSSEKEIISFSFTADANAELSNDINGIINGTTISITVPHGIDVTALVATFTITGKKIIIGNETQISGVTDNDYTNIIEYKVIAENNSSLDYSVSVIYAANTTKDITHFSFTKNANELLPYDIIGSINGTEISIFVPYGTDVTALVASFTTTGETVKVKKVIQSNGSSVNDYSNIVIYSVIAEDGSYQNYPVIVTVSPPAVDSTSYIFDNVTFNMYYCPGGSFPIGLDDSSSETISQGFWVSESEVTYELWCTIYDWATSGTGGAIGEGQYSFKGEGLMGSGSFGTLQSPVTLISWWDAMVFCNAITEYYNAKNSCNLICAYTSDPGFTEPIRNVVDSYIIYIDNKPVNDGSNDPYYNPNASGFRLPSSYEWECAARYKDGNEWTPGDYASGADGDYTNSTATRKVAVYDTNFARPAMSKEPNLLRCYDMTGNVEEYCFDWYFNSVSRRVVRDGSYSNSGTNWLPVGHFSYCGMFDSNSYRGFRLFRSGN